MYDDQDYNYIFDATVYDNAGDKVGKVGNLYLDDKTGQPSWVTVNTGLFGMSESFVPVDGNLNVVDDRIDVPYTKDQIKDAPRIDADGHLDRDQERELYAYYSRDYDYDTDVDRDLDSGVALDRDRDAVVDRDIDRDRDVVLDPHLTDRDRGLGDDLTRGDDLRTDRVASVDDDRDLIDQVTDRDRDYGRDGSVTDAPVDRERLVETDDVDRDTGLSLDRDRDADLHRDLGDHTYSSDTTRGDTVFDERNADRVSGEGAWDNEGGHLDEQGTVRRDQSRMRRYNRPTL